MCIISPSRGANHCEQSPSPLSYTLHSCLTLGKWLLAAWQKCAVMHETLAKAQNGGACCLRWVHAWVGVQVAGCVCVSVYTASVGGGGWVVVCGWWLTPKCCRVPAAPGSRQQASCTHRCHFVGCSGVNCKLCNFQQLTLAQSSGEVQKQVQQQQQIVKA